jgi:hypothetical protein
MAKALDDGQETVQALLETLVDTFEATLRQVGPSPSHFPFYILTFLVNAETERRLSHSMPRHLICPLPNGF